MTGFDRVRRSGFHTDLIERLVKHASGGALPPHNLFLLETAFDDDSVFRHFDYLGLAGRLLIAIHIDELASGPRWYMNLIPISKITGLEVAQVVLPAQPDDKEERGSSEATHASDTQQTGITVVASFASQRSIELEPLQCDDPTCTADHGLVGGGKDEGLVMTFVSQSESSNEDDAMEFVAVLAQAMAQ